MRRLAVCVLVGLFLLTACDLNSAPEQTPQPPTATPEPTSTPPPPTPTPKPVRQTLRLHIDSEPDIIDPQRAESFDEIDVAMKVFSNLLAFDAEGSLVPEMASALPDLSADGLTYTFKLKPGLKFSDGRALTARDFEYGWKRQLDPAIASPNAFSGYALAGAEAYATADQRKVPKADLQKLRDAVGVRAVDDLTLEFRLASRASHFLSILATWNGLPVRQDIIAKAGDKWTDPATYIGNGPYILQDWQHQARMVFAANPNYARGKPPIERIDLIVNNSQAALIAFLNGELDAMLLGPNELAQVQGNPSLSPQLHWRMTGCTTYYGFNTTRAPFDNVKVRRAVAQAFDRDQYIKNFEKGLGRVADQFVPPGLPGNYGGLKPLKFDADAAKKELADAGFPSGKGLPEIKIGYVAGGRNQARAEWLQAQLKANLGIDIKADPQDARTYRDNGAKPQTTPQLFLYAWCQDYPDPQDWYSVVFDSRNTLPYRTFWKNDRYDQLVRAADAEPDLAKRAAGYTQAAQLLLDNAPAAFVDYSADAWLVRPYIAQAKLTPLDYIFSGTTLMNLKILAH